MRAKTDWWLLVWLLIPLGLFAMIAVPNLLTARNRSRQKRTMADMRTLSTAIEARATDVRTYDLDRYTGPMNEGDAKQFDTLHRVSYANLERALVPTYTKNPPPRFDGWGTEFDVRVNGNKDLYALRSAGSDRVFEQKPYEYGAVESTQLFEADIVFSLGNFIRYPEGSCSP